MSSKIILTNKDLHQIVKQIKEQVEGDYYKISPEEYIQLMSLGSYHGKAITKMKKFQGKPLWITGDLKLSNTPTDSLGNVGYVDGSLNIANTKVSSIEGTNVKGWVADSNSPRERIREKQELNAKLAQQDILRDNNEWDFKNGDETGEKAQALFENLINNGEIDLLSDEDKEKLTILRRKLQDLEQEYEGLDDNDDRAYEVQEAIDETQSEIDELEENDADVYMMYPNSRYTHYGLTQFEVLIPGFKNNEYTVGTEEEMDDAALQYAKNYIDDVGAEGFNESFIEDYLDVDAIIRIAEEDYEYQVRDYPDSYFNDDDFELTEEQEARIEVLESQIEDLEQQKLELDSDDDNYYDYEEDLDNQIEALQEELDGIEVDTEPTEDMIENKVAELVRDVRRDPLDYLKNYGLSIKEYIDEDALAQGLVDSDGWGVMNGYDGQYDSEEVNGVTYYIMRTN